MNPNLLLDLGLDVLDGVRPFNFKSDGVAGGSSDEKLEDS
jgi:hypothetical protein